MAKETTINLVEMIDQVLAEEVVTQRDQLLLSKLKDAASDLQHLVKLKDESSLSLITKFVRGELQSTIKDTLAKLIHFSDQLLEDATQLDGPLCHDVYYLTTLVLYACDEIITPLFDEDILDEVAPEYSGSSWNVFAAGANGAKRAMYSSALNKAKNIIKIDPKDESFSKHGLEQVVASEKHNLLSLAPTKDSSAVTPETEKQALEKLGLESQLASALISENISYTQLFKCKAMRLKQLLVHYHQEHGKNSSDGSNKHLKRIQDKIQNYSSEGKKALEDSIKENPEQFTPASIQRANQLFDMLLQNNALLCKELTQAFQGKKKLRLTLLPNAKAKPSITSHTQQPARTTPSPSPINVERGIQPSNAAPFPAATTRATAIETETDETLDFDTQDFNQQRVPMIAIGFVLTAATLLLVAKVVTFPAVSTTLGLEFISIMLACVGFSLACYDLYQHPETLYRFTKNNRHEVVDEPEDHYRKRKPRLNTGLDKYNDTPGRIIHHYPNPIGNFGLKRNPHQPDQGLKDIAKLGNEDLQPIIKMTPSSGY